MARCKGTKKDGSPCRLPPAGDDGFCWAHSPSNAEERQRVASKGGRGKAKGAQRTDELWREVRGMIGATVRDEIHPTKANSLYRGIGTLLAIDKRAEEWAELEIAQRRLELDEEERTDLKKRLELLEETQSVPWSPHRGA